MKNYSKKFGTVLLAYFLISIIFGVGASAQASTIYVKTLPKCDTLDVSMLGDNVLIEMLETSKDFERIEISVQINQEESKTSKNLFASGVFSASTSHIDGSSPQGTTVVEPNKQEIYITVQGQDVVYLRTYKVFASPTTVVKRNQKPSL